MAEENTAPTPPPLEEPTASPEVVVSPEETFNSPQQSSGQALQEPGLLRDARNDQQVEESPRGEETPVEAQPIDEAQGKTAQAEQQTAQTRGMSRLAKRVSRSIPLTTSRWLSPRRHLPKRRSHLGHVR